MKLSLTNDILIEQFFDTSQLLGIVAPLADYRFIGNVNRYLQYDFRLNTELEIPLRKKERQYYFSIYEFPEPGCCMVHYIYKNQHDGEFLLPEYKHLDYLWLAKGEEMEKQEVSALQNAIKQLPAVQMVADITYDKIKNKQNLIL